MKDLGKNVKTALLFWKTDYCLKISSKFEENLVLILTFYNY